MKIKFQVLNDFRAPALISKATDFVALFSHDNGDVLEKNDVKIIDIINAIGEISLSDFEVQGLQSGKGQSFILKYSVEGKRYTANFPDAYSVEIDNEGRKKIDEN